MTNIEKDVHYQSTHIKQYQNSILRPSEPKNRGVSSDGNMGGMGGAAASGGTGGQSDGSFCPRHGPYLTSDPAPPPRFENPMPHVHLFANELGVYSAHRDSTSCHS